MSAPRWLFVAENGRAPAGWVLLPLLVPVPEAVPRSAAFAPSSDWAVDVEHQEAIETVAEELEGALTYVCVVPECVARAAGLLP